MGENDDAHAYGWRRVPGQVLDGQARPFRLLICGRRRGNGAGRGCSPVCSGDDARGRLDSAMHISGVAGWLVENEPSMFRESSCPIS